MYRPNHIEMQRACWLFKGTNSDVCVRAVEAVLRS